MVTGWWVIEFIQLPFGKFNLILDIAVSKLLYPFEFMDDIMKKSNILMIIAAILPLFLFVFPMWNITLEAPQYPIPLGINISINNMVGAHEGDIQNIDLMNHYVGMKKLPVEMKEFDIFPIVIVAMSILGIIIGLLGKKQLFLVWFVVMVILGTVGMYDFYLWLYDYGHNLNSHAPIKMPGQAYMPPLFGTKQILNFTAHSYPMLGSLFLFLGICLSPVAFLLSRKEQRK